MQPTASYLFDCHRYAYEDLGIEVSLDRFTEDSRDGLIAEITVTTGREPRPGLLHHGRLNLSSARSRADVIRALEKRNGNGFLDDVDFAGILEQVSWGSLKRWREGDPSIVLADAEKRATGRYLVHPFLQEDAINVLFGDGESAKSTLALALGVSVATGRNILGYMRGEPRNVLYLDWEATAQDHRERLEALCAGLEMDVPRNIYYRRMAASLHSSVAAVRKEMGALQIGFVIGDSIGMAGGDEPERAGTKIQVFGAARSLQRTFLGIDHVSKADANKAFGSVYTRNIARLMWGISKVRSDDGNRLTVRLRNEKINHGKGHKPAAYYVDFMSDDSEDNLLQVTIQAADIKLLPEPRETLSHAGAIQSVLLQNEGGLRVFEIVDALAADGIKVAPATVNTTCWRGQHKAAKPWSLSWVKDGATYWGADPEWRESTRAAMPF